MSDIACQSLAKQREALQRLLILLTRTDAYNMLNRGDEDLAVADFAGFGGGFDRF